MGHRNQLDGGKRCTCPEQEHKEYSVRHCVSQSVDCWHLLKACFGQTKELVTAVHLKMLKIQASDN